MLFSSFVAAWNRATAAQQYQVCYYRFLSCCGPLPPVGAVCTSICYFLMSHTLVCPFTRREVSSMATVSISEPRKASPLTVTGLWLATSQVASTQLEWSETISICADHYTSAI